jgi:hypothetical protein
MLGLYAASQGVQEKRNSKFTASAPASAIASSSNPTHSASPSPLKGTVLLPGDRPRLERGRHDSNSSMQALIPKPGAAPLLGGRSPSPRDGKQKDRLAGVGSGAGNFPSGHNVEEPVEDHNTPLLGFPGVGSRAPPSRHQQVYGQGAQPTHFSQSPHHVAGPPRQAPSPLAPQGASRYRIPSAYQQKGPAIRMQTQAPPPNLPAEYASRFATAAAESAAQARMDAQRRRETAAANRVYRQQSLDASMRASQGYGEMMDSTDEIGRLLLDITHDTQPANRVVSGGGFPASSSSGNNILAAGGHVRRSSSVGKGVDLQRSRSGRIIAMSVVGEDGNVRRLSQREVAAKMRTTPSLAAAATAAGMAAPSQLAPVVQEHDLLGDEMEDEPMNVVDNSRKRYHMQARSNQIRQNAPPSYVVRSTEPPHAAGASIRAVSPAVAAPSKEAPQPSFSGGSAYTQPFPSLESQPIDLGMDPAIYAAFSEANTTIDGAAYPPRSQGGAPIDPYPYQSHGATLPPPLSPSKAPPLQRSRRTNASMSPSRRSSAQFESRRASWQDPAAAESTQARPASYQPSPVLAAPQYGYQAPQPEQGSFAMYAPSPSAYRPDGAGAAYGRRYQNTGALQHPPSSQQPFDYHP